MRYRTDIYICAICGKHEEGELDQDSLFIGTYLPRGWRGSHKRNGEYICKSCYEHMEELKYEIPDVRSEIDKERLQEEIKYTLSLYKELKNSY